MNKILRKITLLSIITIILLVTANCEIISPEKKEDNSALLALALLSSSQSSSRAPGVYISGKLVGSDSTTAIANATITIKGRGEAAAIVRTGVTATTPAGFYQNVLSTGTSPVTLYGNTTGTPTNATRDTECGTTVVSMYSTSTTNRVICDSSALDATAKTSGISDALIAVDTEVGTITSGADGTFSQIKF